MKNFKKNALKSSKGITLIALVITIIVLLILAGISISMLAGDNSILQKATDANERTSEAQIKEEIGLAWNGVQTEGIVNDWDINKKAEELQKELRKEDSMVTTTASGNTINVKKFKGYDALINTTDGSFTSFAKTKENGEENNTLALTVNERETESRAVILEITSEDEKATILECEGQSEKVAENRVEFVVTQNGNYQIIGKNDEGEIVGTYEVQVIKCLNRNDNKEEKYSTTAAIAQTGKSSETIKDKDNVDVEIPKGFYYGTSTNVGKVATGFVITDSVDTSTGYSNGNEFVWIPIDYNSSTGAMTVKGTSKPMAKATSGTTDNLANYQGSLYSEFLANSNPNSSYVQGTNNYREPVVLSYAAEDYSSQGDYNKMIQSVKKYGGFYVARYEMGKGDNNYSKVGSMPTSAGVRDENMWYGLYNKAKSYNKSSITAEMIWGSQYDAMLNFGLTNSIDSSKIITNANGNHSGKKLRTGTWLGSAQTNPERDSINNIFDLEGNMFEWTKERSSDAISCVLRGGCYNSYGTNSPSFRGSNSPNYPIGDVGSRLSFYIN